MPATIIDQLTPYTCSLACLESYFIDIKKPLSQCEILKNHYDILEVIDPAHKHEYGAIDRSKIIHLCTKLGFTAILYQDFRQKEVEQIFDDALKANNGIFIIANWNNKSSHCVRLSRIKATGLYEAMCPIHPKSAMIDVKFSDLVQWGFMFLIIS